MATTPTAPLERKLKQARRRLVAQLFLNRLGLSWGGALAVTLSYVALAPFIVPDAAGWVCWSVLGGTMLGATVLALWLTRRGAPTRLTTAIALDQRFALKERVTTVLALAPSEMATPIGQAVLADANAKLENVVVRGQFPVRVGRRAIVLPVLLAVVVLLVLFPPPTLIPGLAVANKPDDELTKVDDPELPRPNTPRTFLKPPEVRPNKSDELKALEAQLEKLYAEHNREENPEKVKPEQLRERVEKIADAEERLRKREKELTEKFQQLQEQLGKLTELDKGESRHEGPGNEFEKALAQGNLQKAQEDIDELRKKARDKKLDANEVAQLKQQLEDLDKKVDQLNREKAEKKEKLKKLIDEAKKENRDAESLERELKQLEQDMQLPKEMRDLAKALKESRKALEMNDFDGLADQLGDLAKALGEMQDGLEDLEDIGEHLQNLKQMKNGACKQCQGEGQDKGKGSDKDLARGYAEGATGKRDEKEDPNAKPGEEQRVRGFFDPRGRKAYGGGVNGPAFKKQTTGELAGEIQQAVQEAPDAIEVQRLPKAAKDMVKEYFEKLGGQAPRK